VDGYLLDIIRKVSEMRAAEREDTEDIEIFRCVLLSYANIGHLT
jgi:hypothetical protein